MGIGVLVVYQVGGFHSPTALFDHLFQLGCEPSDIKAELAPDGLWRGSGARRMHNDWLQSNPEGSDAPMPDASSDKPAL
jgi:hypothetical protein